MAGLYLQRLPAAADGAGRWWRDSCLRSLSTAHSRAAASLEAVICRARCSVCVSLRSLIAGLLVLLALDPERPQASSSTGASGWHLAPSLWALPSAHCKLRTGPGQNTVLGGFNALFFPQAASVLTASCLPALSSLHPTRPHETSSQESIRHMNSQSSQWLIRLRGDLALGDKAKLGVRATKEWFRPPCLERVVFLEGVRRPPYYLWNPRPQRPASLPFSISSQKYSILTLSVLDLAPDPLLVFVRAETNSLISQTAVEIRQIKVSWPYRAQAQPSLTTRGRQLPCPRNSLADTWDTVSRASWVKNATPSPAPAPTPTPARRDPSLPHSGRSHPSRGEDYYNKDNFDLIIFF